MILSINTSFPPYHNNTAMVTIPNTSLNGPAKLFLTPMLLDNFKILSAKALNLNLNRDSAL